MKRIFAVHIIIILFLISCEGNRNNENEIKNSVKIENEDKAIPANTETKGYCPKDGFIPDKETAVSVAEIVLVKIYGKEVLSQRPFLVTLKDNIWIIEGHLEEDMDGGVAYIEIDKQTGQIRKVVHTK
ncbi:NTF2 fold immunity protein [Dysgonomonas sp. ZJ709]|uniref:NTF2 fold immunity protein n=1 Tax=Dysgonomonas sp. ZJ709 TaxID=2709797 RepID=UPI0013EB7E50|nr:NTF2 fold immunity protein [Dysgonomonas sp. ZJ709]